VVLRGRRLERRNPNRSAGVLDLPGRRRRYGLFAPQKPLLTAQPFGSSARSDEDLNPQLTDEMNALGTGENSSPMVTISPKAKGARMFETPVLHRALYLTSDAIVLTLAAPFFAAWWIVRAVRKRFSI
jgi:hypothetical protein